MELEIQGDCETVFGCLKAIIVTLYSIIVICIIARIIYKMHIYTHKTCSFEIIPLSSTILQSLFQLILNVFIMDTKLIISALYSQTLTFGIISTSCSQLCLRIKYPQKQRTAKRYTLIAFSFAQFASIIMYILTLSDVIPLDCNDWFSVAYLFPMGVMLIYTIASISFGSTLINILRTKDDETQKKEIQSEITPQDDTVNMPAHTQSLPSQKIRTKSVMNIIPDKEATFITQLKKQLQLIEFLFLCTIVIQVTMDAIRTYVLSDYIRCEGVVGERSNEFQAYNDWGQVFLTFYQILQITPCLIAPYVFYYVPFKAKKVGGSILFSDQFLSIAIPREGDEEFYSHNNMEGSLDSRLILSENFDFSSEVNFSHNYQNKQKYRALLGNKNVEEENKGQKKIKRKDKQNSPSSKDKLSSVNNTNSNNKKSNGINYSEKSKDNNNTNGDSIFVYHNKNNPNDTLDNIDDFIDRMSMRRGDVDKITSQNKKLGRDEDEPQSSLQFPNTLSNDSIVLSDNILKLNPEKSLSIQSSQNNIQENNQQNIHFSTQSDATNNNKSLKNEVTDQYRITQETQQNNKNK